ncbi:ATP-binding protein [Psychrobacter cryohalolentis]|uniref:Chemotaxis protein CheA n=1 Tax=Psychrobacter cryohalolentis (strain ATCC BAA-1226 / DSM 17306 / VKM B-2378 / K5) TaxID=335284 RepID=Q1QDT5_PSYCK|nr:ATP-binding protein [Psychrobacter cryohalolentis]ABE74168.1 putative CheA signal transduction histidine kinase [Psychrobacter cryohalolentis K5]ASE26801.1 chemotaxis protein CheA [Psychrobacter cryohalolentis]
MATTHNVDNKRYRSLIISIALFLSLIGALLAFTFYTSSLLERNTVLIDKTNQVANSAQAVIKDLFDLDSSYGEDTNSPHIQRVLERLEQNTALITSSITAIEQGGEITDVDGKSYDLPKINNNSQTKVAAANEQWLLLEPKIQTYLKDADNIMVDSSDELIQAVEQAKTSSLLINDSLDQLTDEVFINAERQADTIRLIQILGVAAIFAYFLIFVFFFVRRLRDTDAEALAARRETQEIMETVNTGLFLLDKDLNIGQQHSRALNGIIGEDRLAGENFADVLRGRISDKDLRTTRQFIEQLYNPRVKEKLVDSLNPLHKVMLHNASGEESTTSRFLDFKFSRVYEDKDIARILVNVNDVSDAVYLEQRLEKERSQNDMQIEMLTTILNVNPKIINEFISNTKAHIDKMNNILKNPGSSQFELEGKLKAIYREMHSLKGEASALKLHSFTKIASDAEDKLDALQNQGKLSGNNFLPLAVHLDDLLSLSNTIETLGERINQAAPKANNNAKPVMSVKTATQPSVVQAQVADVATININVDGGNEIDLSDESDDEHLSYYQDFAKDIAIRQGKKIQLNGHNLAHINIPERLKQPIKEISIQLLRNAVVHGIESPEARQSAGKSAIGSIDLEMQRDSQNLIIALQDDGQGIDYEGIRYKLIADGRFTQEEASQMTHGDLLKTLFASGFSTKEHADEDGGRGVGLDVIKALVKEHNGKLNVNTELGKMTRFVITLPAA